MSHLGAISSKILEARALYGQPGSKAPSAKGAGLRGRPLRGEPCHGHRGRSQKVGSEPSSNYFPMLGSLSRGPIKGI